MEVLGSFTEHIDEADIEALQAVVPMQLRYLQWRPFTFCIDRKGSQIKAKRIELPMSFKNHMTIPEKYETTFYDHLKGDYVDRF